jgi:cephalosporin-C deacetylase-like acetyl esterase
MKRPTCCFSPRLGLAVLAASLAAVVVGAQPLTLTPFNQAGLYGLGERVGWTVTLPEGAVAPAGGYIYTIRKNNLAVIKSGRLDLAAGRATIETALDEPAMLYVEVSPRAGPTRAVAGAAVAPTQLQPSVPRPADFDAFWEAKIKALEAVPEDAVLTPGESGRPGVDYWTIKLDNIGGAHVYGQLAKPAREGEFPAMLVLQWASPPYPLQKPWVTDRAAEGWLVLNVEPHDVPGDLPPAFYAALPAVIKNYQTIGNTDRERNYFLQMYLGDYRAVDYLAGRPDWDGRTLVLTGTSMGGQQSLCVAGLHPRVTHVVVNEPAGCDADGSLHGRAAGYPNWDANDPRVMATALYFDPVNFASRIKATCLVSMGFVDETAPPVGIWTAFNQIPGPKEAVPLVDSPHNNQATAAQQRPYTDRSAAWLAALVRGTAPPPIADPARASAPAGH